MGVYIIDQDNPTIHTNIMSIDIYTLTNLVHEIAAEMDYHNPITNSINKRFKVILARVTFKTRHIEWNPKCLTLPAKELEMVIRHEVAHLITNSGDKQSEFTSYCYTNEIPMNPMPVSNHGRYAVVCENCESLITYRHIKSKIIKTIESGKRQYYCLKCKSTNLRVIDRDKEDYPL